MNRNTLNKTFDPQTLANDLCEIRRINAQSFALLAEADWDKPVNGNLYRCIGIYGFNT